MKNRNNNDIENLPDVLKEQKGKNVFEVPENYFEGFRSNLYKNIPVANPVNPFLNFVKTAAFKYAAAASIAGILTISSILIFNNKADNNSPDNNNTQISKVDSLKHSDSDINIAENKDIINIDDIDSNKKQDIIEKEKEFNNLKNDNIAENNKATEINNKKAEDLNRNKSENKKNNTKELDNSRIKDIYQSDPLISNNTIAENNSNNSSSSSNNSESQASAKQNIKQIDLISDTCALDELKLYAPKSTKKEFYLWSNGSIERSISIDKSGKYWLKISKSASFESFEIDTFNIQIIPKPNPFIEENILICSFETIKISSNCSNENYTYKWNISDKNSPSINLSNLSPGYHNIILEVEACNQVFMAESVIRVNDCKIEIPNVITPNGDGHNDYFVIEGLENYPRTSLYIMDRNGKKVFESNNYQNDWGAENLESGTYYYLLRLNDDNKTEKGGAISVIRK